MAISNYRYSRLKNLKNIVRAIKRDSRVAQAELEELKGMLHADEEDWRKAELGDIVQAYEILLSFQQRSESNRTIVPANPLEASLLETFQEN